MMKKADEVKAMPEIKRTKKNATVIPAPRKLVKRMMFDAIVDFVVSLFFSEENPTKIKQIHPDPFQFD